MLTNRCRPNRFVLSLPALLALPLLVGAPQAEAQTAYSFRTLYSVTYNSATGAGDQILSPSINNAGNVLWAGQTQAGPDIFLNSPANNLAAQVPNADTLIDSRLPRFGSASQNAVWNASTGEIDPVTKQKAPNSGYQEDRIYLYKPALSSTPSLIGRTQFGVGLGTVTSPDVNDRGQAVYRRLDYGSLQWSLFVHDGSGLESGTTRILDNYAAIGTTFLDNNGKVAFLGKQNSADPTRLFLYDIGANRLTTLAPSAGFSSPSLRDFSNDDTSLVFDGVSATGAFYTIDTSGNARQVVTAGTNGLARLELGQRNSVGQVVFANRTQTSVGGATPNAGQSDVYVYDNGALRRITNNDSGVSITSANLNDNGDIAFVTFRYLYDASGAYTGLRRYDLVVASAVPEPGAIASLAGFAVCGIGLAIRCRFRRIHAPKWRNVAAAA